MNRPSASEMKTASVMLANAASSFARLSRSASCRRLAFGGQEGPYLRRGGMVRCAMHGPGDPGDHRTGQQKDQQAQPIGRLSQGNWPVGSIQK